MTTPLQLAQMISKALREQSMTVSVLIERSGVSRSAVHRLLKGEEVHISTVLAVTNALGLSLVVIPTAIVAYLPDVLDGTHGNSRVGQFKSQQPSSCKPELHHPPLSDELTAKVDSSPMSAVKRRRLELEKRIQKLMKRR